MKYKLYNSRIIHWDDTLYLLDDHSNSILRDSISIELCKVVDDKLPIIIEGKIQVIDKESPFFNCIIHTKAILKFLRAENPINDLIKMLNECNEQEEAILAEATLGIRMNKPSMTKSDYNPMTLFNKAYELKEYAIKVQLLDAQ